MLKWYNIDEFMDKEKKQITGIALLILSAVSSYLIVVFGYFPSLGLAITFSLLISAAFILKQDKSKINLYLYIFALLLSFFIFFRANQFLTFLNILAVFYLGSLMIIPSGLNKISGFLYFAFSPLILFIRSISAKNNYPINFRSIKINIISGKETGIVKLLKSLGLTFVILIIIIPLLSSANPIFSKLVSDFFKLLKLHSLLETLFSVNYATWIIRLMVFIFLSLVIPRIFTHTNTPSKSRIFGNFLSTVNLLLPKLIVGIVIAVFFKAQAQLYFASDVTLQTLGYSHSQYAREVFAQLSIVALVILGLVYNDKSNKKPAKVLTYFLVIEGIFLTLIALKSVNDYSSMWGFTYKRLWGYTGVIWIFSVFVIFLHKYFKKLSDSCFIKSTIIFSALVLVAVNIVNFDKLIFHYRKSTTQSGIDYYYLSSLSSDAKAYRTLLQLINTQMTGMDTNNRQYREISKAGYRVLRKIDYLQKKYKNIDYRTINLSEFSEYLSIKTLDTSQYYKTWVSI